MVNQNHNSTSNTRLNSITVNNIIIIISTRYHRESRLRVLVPMNTVCACAP